MASVWNWKENLKVQGLYFVYFKRFGLRFGPYYAAIGLAERDMRKALKEFPAGFWEQGLEWYRRQNSFHQWIEKNMGRGDFLVGGQWAKD